MEVPEKNSKQASVTKYKNRGLSNPPSAPVEMTGWVTKASRSVISVEVT